MRKFNLTTHAKAAMAWRGITGPQVALAINASDPVRYVEDGEVILVFQTYLAGEFYPLRVTAVEINAGRRLLVKSACWKDKPAPEGPMPTKPPEGWSAWD